MRDIYSPLEIDEEWDDRAPAVEGAPAVMDKVGIPVKAEVQGPALSKEPPKPSGELVDPAFREAEGFIEGSTSNVDDSTLAVHPGDEIFPVVKPEKIINNADIPVPVIMTDEFPPKKPELPKLPKIVVEPDDIVLITPPHQEKPKNPKTPEKPKTSEKPNDELAGILDRFSENMNDIKIELAELRDRLTGELGDLEGKARKTAGDIADVQAGIARIDEEIGKIPNTKQ